MRMVTMGSGAGLIAPHRPDRGWYAYGFSSSIVKLESSLASTATRPTRGS